MFQSQVVHIPTRPNTNPSKQVDKLLLLWVETQSLMALGTNPTT